MAEQSLSREEKVALLKIARAACPAVMAWLECFFLTSATIRMCSAPICLR